MESSSNLIGIIIFSIIVGIGLIFVLREFVCWYFKINERKKLMEAQNNLLWDIKNLLETQAKSNNR